MDYCCRCWPLFHIKSIPVGTEGESINFNFQWKSGIHTATLAGIMFFFICLVSYLIVYFGMMASWRKRFHTKDPIKMWYKKACNLIFKICTKLLKMKGIQWLPIFFKVFSSIELLQAIYWMSLGCLQVGGDKLASMQYHKLLLSLTQELVGRHCK